MWMKWMRAGGLVWLLLSCGCGGDSNRAAQNKPVTPTKTSATPVAGETITKIHWLGMSQLARETNATNFMAIWNLPESQKLEVQTLDKLATAPWRLMLHQPSTNAITPMAASPLLRPLLDDLVNAESYLEIRQATNQPGQLAFAIRVDTARAGLWQTNLAAVLESLTGVKAASLISTKSGSGFSVKKHHEPDLIELTRVGDWTVFGLAQEENLLLKEMVSRIEKEKKPFPARTTNFWVEVEVDPVRVAQAFPRLFQLPDSVSPHVPMINLSAIGDGQNVHTRGEFRFAKQFAFKLDPWTIPTNLIHDPLISFTAVRGFRNLGQVNNFRERFQILGEVNQFFCWAINGNPFQTQFAAPVAGDSSLFKSLSKQLLEKANPWLSANGLGRLEELSGKNHIDWNGLFLIKPFLKWETGAEFVTGGLTPNETTNPPPPAALFNQLSLNPNLFWYDWELTGPRVEDWVYIGQLLRFGLHKAQMPAEALGISWLRALETRAGNSVTEASIRGGDDISFLRKSAIGLSAIEIHLLSDWLESSDFPKGLHSFLPEKSPLKSK